MGNKKKNRSKKTQSKNADNASTSKSVVDSEPSISQQDNEGIIAEKINDANKSETSVSIALATENKNADVKSSGDYDNWFEDGVQDSMPVVQKDTSSSFTMGNKKKNRSKKTQSKNADNASTSKSVADSEPSIPQQDNEGIITEKINDANKSKTSVSIALATENKNADVKYNSEYDNWFEDGVQDSTPVVQKDTSSNWGDDAGFQEFNESFDGKTRDRDSRGKYSQGRNSHSSRNSSDYNSSFSRRSFDNSKNSSTSSMVRRSGQERDEDDKEFTEFCDFFKTKCKAEGVVMEKQGDLFEMSEDYALAHCVAEDMAMGSGIAVTFRQNFKRVDELLSQNQRSGGLAVLNHNGRFIYYLVTKRRSTGKPTMQNLCRSLQKMRQHMIENKVEKLAMPRIGCGLDRLEWSEVKSLIEFLFNKVNVEIVVCNFQQALNDVQNEDKNETEPITIKSDTVLENANITEDEYVLFGNYIATSLKNIATKSLSNVVTAQKEIFHEQESTPDDTPNKKLRKAKIVDVSHPLIEMEAETMFIYFGTVDGSVSKQLHELNEKFNFVLNAYKQAKRELGRVIRTDIRRNVYLAHGCIVREKECDPFNFIHFQKCLQEIKKLNKKDEYYYVAFEPFNDKHDNMLTEKILTLLRYTLFDNEIHVCWSGEMLKFMPKPIERS